MMGAWAALTWLEAVVEAQSSGVASARERNQKIILRGRQAHKPAPRATALKQNRDSGEKKNKSHFLISADQTGAGAGGRASVQARGVFSPQQHGDYRAVAWDCSFILFYFIFFLNFSQGFL